MSDSLSEAQGGVLTLAAVPGGTYARECLFRRPKPCYRNPGVNIDFALIIAMNILGFQRVDFVRVNKFKVASNETEPRKWEGILGSVARHEVDASASLVYIESKHELKAADFSLPVVITEFGLIVHKPKPDEISALTFLFLRPFHFNVWILTLILIAVNFGFGKLVYPKIPKVFFYKTVVSLGVFFLMRSYRSLYIKNRVVYPFRSLPFANQEEFLDALLAGRARLLISSMTGSTAFGIAIGKGTFFTQLRRALRVNPPMIVIDREEMIRLISENVNYAMLAPSQRFGSALQLHCNLAFVTFPAFPQKIVSMPFRKGSGLAQRFNTAFYGGSFSAADLYERLRRHYNPKDTCPTDSMSELTGSGPIQMREISPVLIIYSVIIGLCCGVFCFESFVTKWAKKFNRQNAREAKRRVSREPLILLKTRSSVSRISDSNDHEGSLDSHVSPS